MTISRKGIIAGGTMLIATGRSAFAQTALTPIRVASNPVNDVTPVIYAQNTGLFKNAGLDVTLQKATNGSAVAAALAGNAIDIGKVYIQAHRAGADGGRTRVPKAHAGIFISQHNVRIADL